MPGYTPNRNYPYPVDADDLNVAHDIENLGEAIDIDVNGVIALINAEAAARIAGDNALSGQIGVRAAQAVINGVNLTERVLVHGSYSEVTLNEFAVYEVVFPVPFASVPVMIANPSASPQYIGIGTELVTATKGHVFGRLLTDGTPAYSYILAFTWIAIGFRA
jgi:hypothetical protein